MDNKTEKINQNNIVDSFVKTDDILKDMCRVLTKSSVPGGQHNADTEKLASWL